MSMCTGTASSTNSSASEVKSGSAASELARMHAAINTTCTHSRAESR